MKKGLLYATAFLTIFGLGKNLYSQTDTLNEGNFVIENHVTTIEKKVVPLDPTELATNPKGENLKFPKYTPSDQKACVWYLTDLITREREGYLSDSTKTAQNYMQKISNLTKAKDKKISELEKKLKELQDNKLPQKLEDLKEQIKTLKEENKKYEGELKDYQKKN